MLGKGNQGSAQKMNRKAWQHRFPKQEREHWGLEDFQRRQSHCPLTVVSKEWNYFLFLYLRLQPLLSCSPVKNVDFFLPEVSCSSIGKYLRGARWRSERRTLKKQTVTHKSQNLEKRKRQTKEGKNKDKLKRYWRIEITGGRKERNWQRRRNPDNFEDKPLSQSCL